MGDFFTIPVKLRSLSVGQYHAWLSRMANSQRYRTQGRARRHVAFTTLVPVPLPRSLQASPRHTLVALRMPHTRTSTLEVAEGMTKNMAA